MITIDERIRVIDTLLSLLSSEGLTLSTVEKKTIKEVMLEHVTYLQSGYLDNGNPSTEEEK
ncbi:MAG: hypothetical protein P8J32_05725 [bacterium]|nr:hypothetical protein [bacterium]